MMVTGFREIDGFREFCLQKKKNMHSVCRFMARKGTYTLDDGIFSKPVKVFGCEDTNSPSVDSFLMTGIPQSIKEIEGYDENLISVTISSKSSRLGQGRHTRIFQSMEKTYRSILDCVCRSQGFEISFLKEGLGEVREERPVIQLGETDMEFICRIASELETSVWVDDKSDGVCQIRIGDKRGDSAIEIDRGNLMVLERECFADSEKIRIQVNDSEEALWSLDVGKQIRIDGKNYIIEELNICRQHQVYKYECLASWNRISKDTRQDKGTKRIPVYHFTGRVTDNKDPENKGRVRVDFSSEDIQDVSDNHSIWIDVLTPYDGDRGGVLFIPDIEDWVDVLWDGRELLVTGVRRREAIAKEYQNIDEKWIVDQKGRRVCFGQEALRLSSEDSIVLVNEDKVEIRNGNTGIVIKDGTIHMDIEKRLECNVKRDIILEGKKVTITGENRVEIN